MPPETADPERLRVITETLERYIRRHGELVAEVEREMALAATSIGYAALRAAHNAKAARSKISMYEPEIDLLRAQLMRMATDSGDMPRETHNRPEQTDNQA